MFHGVKHPSASLYSVLRRHAPKAIASFPLDKMHGIKNRRRKHRLLKLAQHIDTNRTACAKVLAEIGRSAVMLDSL